MSDRLSADELKLAQILVEALSLDDIQADDIVPEAALFGHEPDSLGLDSIDALEIAQTVAQHWNVQLRADDDNNKVIFSSLRNLTNHILAEHGPL